MKPPRAVRITAVAASAQLGGTERVLLDFADRAFEHDVELRVLTPRDGPLIGILNEIGVPAEAVPAGQRLLSASQRQGGFWSAPAALAGLMAWAGRLRRHPFFAGADAVYTVSFKTHLAVAALRRHPVVWHLHEYPPELTGIVWRTLSRYVPDAMIANSNATAQAWARPCTVIPNGVHLDRFRPRARGYWIHERLGIPREHRLIGMPAVFARWKGQLEVMEAFSAVQAQHPDVHLVIVGGSIYDTVAEREYGEALGSAVPGKAQGIHLLPFQPKIELVYPELDLVVHYSLRPEPFGRVILEAMASGVPVIGAAEGGPVEILGLGDGETPDATAHPPARPGWLVPPRDVPALAHTLRQALARPASDLRAMGEAARRRAEDQFSARRFARRVADVLRGVVLKKSGND